MGAYGYMSVAVDGTWRRVGAPATASERRRYGTNKTGIVRPTTTKRRHSQP